MWDEATKIIPINVISSEDIFGYAVSLSGGIDLIGDYHSDEKCDDSGVAYIICRINGVMAGGI